MFRTLWALLIGCDRCPEKDKQIASLERRLSDLSDRFMSRDFSAYLYAKANAEQLAQPVEKPKARIDNFMDGLGPEDG